MRNFTRLLFTGLFLLLFSVFGIAQKIQNQPHGKATSSPQQVKGSQFSVQSKIDSRLATDAAAKLNLQSDKSVSQKPQQPNKAEVTDKATAAGVNSLSISTTGTGATANSIVNTSATVTTGDVVDIKCRVTPALVKLITDAGGVLISSSKEDNIITAKVPADALQKIASSSDVKHIRQSPIPAPNPAAAKSGTLAGNSSGNTSFSRNIISETVLKARKQNSTQKLPSY